MPRYKSRLIEHWKSADDEQAVERRDDHDIPPREKPKFDRKLYEQVLRKMGYGKLVKELDKFYGDKK